MLRALFYKEWIKLRWPFLILGILGLASLVQAGLSLRYLVVMKGAGELWEGLILKQQMPYASHLVFPEVCGLILGAFQWFPETRKRSLRLLLHLPLKEGLLVFVVVGTGLLLAVGLSLLHGFGLILIYGLSFPWEITEGLMLAWLPHLLTGMLLYCGAAMVLMETAWWRRIAGVLLVYGFYLMLMEGGQPGTYAPSMGSYALAGLLPLVMLFLPVLRARRGGSL